MKSWIAIDLKDYHDKSKTWQGGKVNNVRVKVIGALSLENAKRTARLDNTNAWLVYSLNTTKNIAYKD